MLVNAEKRQLKWNMVETALGLEFPPEQVEQQLENLIQWGRYGELLSNNEGSEMIGL